MLQGNGGGRFQVSGTLFHTMIDGQLASQMMDMGRSSDVVSQSGWLRGRALCAPQAGVSCRLADCGGRRISVVQEALADTNRPSREVLISRTQVCMTLMLCSIRKRGNRCGKVLMRSIAAVQEGGGEALGIALPGICIYSQTSGLLRRSQSHCTF